MKIKIFVFVPIHLYFMRLFTPPHDDDMPNLEKIETKVEDTFKYVLATEEYDTDIGMNTQFQD